MIKKLVGIFVMTLLIATSLSATSAINVQTFGYMMENNDLEHYTNTPSNSPGDITIVIHAEVRVVDDDYNLLGGAIQVGDLILGKYVYNSATPDSNPSPNIGGYWHDSSPYGIAFTVGGFVFKTDPNNVNFSIVICNDYYYFPWTDFYGVSCNNNLQLSNGLLVNHILWMLKDYTGNAISSDALPTTAPVLSDWSNNTLSVYGKDPEYPYYYSLEANVTEATVVSRSKTRDIHFTMLPVLIWIAEKFPNLFPILRQLLRIS